MPEQPAGIRVSQSSGTLVPDGAGNRVRTGDIQLGKLTLYQLSYARVAEEQYNQSPAGRQSPGRKALRHRQRRPGASEPIALLMDNRAPFRYHRCANQKRNQPEPKPTEHLKRMPHPFYAPVPQTA
jgi:hypothetical protein